MAALVRRLIAAPVRLHAMLFRERELLLRSGDRVRFLRLTPAFQLCLVLGIVGAATWAVGMTAASLLQRHVIEAKQGEIEDARVAYDDLLDEVTSYQHRVAQVTGSLRENQLSLLRYMTQIDKSSDIAAVIGSKRGDSGSESVLAVDSPKDFADRVTALDMQLQQMTETNRLLAETLTNVKTEIQLAHHERAQIVSARSTLRDRVDRLEDELIETRSVAARFKRQVLELSGDLDHAEASYSGVVEQRAALEQRVSTLETDLVKARSRGTALETDLRKVVGQLGQATGDNGAVPAGDVRHQVDGLLEQLASLHAAHESVLDRLSQRTLSNIEEAERLIAMTGLEVEQLIRRGGVAMGQGGPLIEAETAAAETETAGGLGQTVATIDSQLTRWELMKSLLRVIPLTAPVDNYHLASEFGQRRDPFTGKRAVHQGLDLSGRIKAPIFATAPGKVVLGGWKARYGKMVEIDHGFGIRTRYAHLHTVTVKAGQEVSYRDKIGLLGSTGRSNGPHVHYEILFDGKPIDPMKFIRAGQHVFQG